MMIQLEAGEISQFLPVLWVNAGKNEQNVHLVFSTTIDGRRTGLRVSITPSQWENLKFLIDGPKPAVH